MNTPATWWVNGHCGRCYIRHPKIEREHADEPGQPVRHASRECAMKCVGNPTAKDRRGGATYPRLVTGMEGLCFRPCWFCG